MSMKPFSYFPGKNQNPDRIVIADREYTLSQFGELANGIDARDRRSCFSTREKKSPNNVIQSRDSNMVTLTSSPSRGNQVRLACHPSSSRSQGS